MKKELGDKIRSWYESYEGCPPWSSFYGFITRDRKAQKQELAEKIEGMKKGKIGTKKTDKMGRINIWDGYNQALEDIKNLINEDTQAT